MRDLRTLETFVWVARLGGFRAASARLNTTQPAISARIDQLERDLGVTLFHRGQRPIGLTPEGAVLLDHAEQMLEKRAEMLRAVASPATMRGTLRMGLSETLVHTLLPRLVERIGAAYPAIVLDMVVDITPTLRAGLLAGQIDIAMMAGTVEPGQGVSEPLCDYPLCWVASPRLGLPEGPLRLAELTRWPILSFSHGTSVSADLRRAFAAAPAPGLRLWGSASITAMARLAEQGIGVSVMQEVLVRRELAAGTLRPLTVADVTLPRVGFHVAYLRRPDSHLAAAAARLAHEVAGEPLPDEG